MGICEDSSSLAGGVADGTETVGTFSVSWSSSSSGVRGPQTNPHGVISPVLFSFYTSDCLSSCPDCTIIKYADDTVITGYLINNDTTSYLKVVTEFTNWCERHFLLINVKKTKELIVDFRRNTKAHDPLCISGPKGRKG